MLLSTDVQPILTKHCATAGCHTGATPAGGLNLSNGKTDKTTVDVASTCKGAVLITPGDPAKSYLLAKLNGATGICGAKMPLSGSISAGEIQTISAWIGEGAKNN